MQYFVLSCNRPNNACHRPNNACHRYFLPLERQTKQRVESNAGTAPGWKRMGFHSTDTRRHLPSTCPDTCHKTCAPPSGPATRNCTQWVRQIPTRNGVCHRLRVVMVTTTMLLLRMFLMAMFLAAGVHANVQELKKGRLLKCASHFTLQKIY